MRTRVHALGRLRAIMPPWPAGQEGCTVLAGSTRCLHEHLIELSSCRTAQGYNTPYPGVRRGQERRRRTWRDALCGSTCVLSAGRDAGRLCGRLDAGSQSAGRLGGTHVEHRRLTGRSSSMRNKARLQASWTDTAVCPTPRERPGRRQGLLSDHQSDVVLPHVRH